MQYISILILLIFIQLIYSFDNKNPDCLLKNQIFKNFNRERRASISRPYFNHWRQTRDNIRYSPKNSLAFSPRLGKRATPIDNNDDQLINIIDNYPYRSDDEFENFLFTLGNYLQEKQIDIIYEDSFIICFSQPINDIIFKEQNNDKNDINRRSQDEQDKDETRGRQTIGKHPVLFRYRLG